MQLPVQRIVALIPAPDPLYDVEDPVDAVIAAMSASGVLAAVFDSGVAGSAA